MANKRKKTRKRNETRENKRQDGVCHAKSGHKNVPRFDPHTRLLSRFYEPLILLNTLGRTRGEHRPAQLPTGSNLDNWPIKHVRRLFLLEAAYLCDYKTGGDTVTAIALERNPQGRTLWVAANSCPEKTIVPFLEALLTKLKCIDASHVCPEEMTNQITADCIKFSHRRIKAYADFTCMQIEKSKGSLEEEVLKDQKCESFLSQGGLVS